MSDPHLKVVGLDGKAPVDCAIAGQSRALLERILLMNPTCVMIVFERPDTVVDRECVPPIGSLMRGLIEHLHDDFAPVAELGDD